MTGFFSHHRLSVLAFPARIYLAILFLTACWHKILHPGAFALDIDTYQILPLVLVNPMAIVLPWVEFVAGFMLLIGYRTRTAALLVTGMMSVFTMAIVIAVHRGLDMSCGCFASQGMTEDPISWMTVLRDLGWLFLSLYVFFYDRGFLGFDNRGTRKQPTTSK